MHGGTRFGTAEGNARALYDRSAPSAGQIKRQKEEDERKRVAAVSVHIARAARGGLAGVGSGCLSLSVRSPVSASIALAFIASGTRAFGLVISDLCHAVLRWARRVSVFAQHLEASRPPPAVLPGIVPSLLVHSKCPIACSGRGSRRGRETVIDPP